MEPYSAPYNEDPIVHVPRAFARQLERELEEQKSRTALAIEVLGDIDQRFNLYVPAPNCSCHISPPCSDCTDNGGKRETLEALQRLLTK